MPPIPLRWKPLPAGVGFGLLLALSSGGCSSTDQDAELVTQDRFAERFASVWCQSVAPCCTAAKVAYDRATCLSQSRTFADAMLASRVQGETTYSASAGTVCLARVEAALKGCEIEEASSACTLIFVGPSADGTPCLNSSACASGYCAPGEAALSGVCRAARYQSPNHGNVGEPCVGSCGIPGSFQCPSSLLPNSDGTTTYCYAEDGLYCSFDSLLDALSCQPYAAVGAECTEDARCIPGAFCAGGTCLAQHGSGPCADTPERCEAQSYCDSQQQCQAKSPNGDPCLSGAECTSSSCSSAGETEGVCDSGSTLTARACSGAL